MLKIIKLKNKFVKKLKRFSKEFFCDHDGRKIKFYPESENTYWHEGKNSGKHEGIVLVGCCKCRKVWLQDFME